MVSSSHTGLPLVVRATTEPSAGQGVDKPDTPRAADPRLQAALDDLARNLAKLEHLLPALEGLDGRLREMAQGLQAHAGVAATAHGRAAAMVAVQKADASSRQAGMALLPGVGAPAADPPGLDLAHGAS